ncbi:putative heavy-metal-binding-domain-containing protein [Linnemannia elongata]|nr:putative heavy-metal-binding-domain-containing protein [Linnemannia elongata]
MKNQPQNQPVRAVDRRFSTTAFKFPGYTISQSHGVVRGLTVRTPNVGKAVFGAFASLGGGESSVYIEMAEKARETAFIRLLEHAAAVGGNAVIGIQFTGQEIAEDMTEVMCYGTSVTLVPTQAPQKY